MSTKSDYYESVQNYNTLENELIAFLTSATGEDLYTVFDVLKGVYDPSDENSVLAAAYALEIDIITSEPVRLSQFRTVLNREHKDKFLSEHSDLICEVLTIREYCELVDSGTPFNQRLFDLIGKFEAEKDAYFKRFDVVYKPCSLEFEKIIEKLKDTSYLLYIREKSLNGPSIKQEINRSFFQSILIIIGCIAFYILIFLLAKDMY